jgi:hypothetical protein
MATHFVYTVLINAQSFYTCNGVSMFWLTAWDYGRGWVACVPWFHAVASRIMLCCVTGEKIPVLCLPKCRCEITFAVTQMLFAKKSTVYIPVLLIGTKAFSPKQSREENNYITARRRRVLVKLIFLQLATTFDTVGPLSSLQCTQSLNHIDPDVTTSLFSKIRYHMIIRTLVS